MTSTNVIAHPATTEIIAKRKKTFAKCFSNLVKKGQLVSLYTTLR